MRRLESLAIFSVEYVLILLRIILLDLHTIWVVLTILHRMVIVAAFGAFEFDEHAVAFCHLRPPIESGQPC